VKKKKKPRSHTTYAHSRIFRETESKKEQNDKKNHNPEKLSTRNSKKTKKTSTYNETYEKNTGLKKSDTLLIHGFRVGAEITLSIL